MVTELLCRLSGGLSRRPSDMGIVHMCGPQDLESLLKSPQPALMPQLCSHHSHSSSKTTLLKGNSRPSLPRPMEQLNIESPGNGLPGT